MDITQDIRDWCYAECERQHATSPADIEGMVRAWQYAASISDEFGRDVDVNDLVIMAQYIDPIANPNGRFRTGPAVFMDGGTSLPAHRIESVLSGFISMIGEMTPEMVYRELMYIHPFKDGNGRVGALVYNWLNGTLNNPVVPPPYK